MFLKILSFFTFREILINFEGVSKQIQQFVKNVYRIHYVILADGPLRNIFQPVDGYLLGYKMPLNKSSYEKTEVYRDNFTMFTCLTDLQFDQIFLQMETSIVSYVKNDEQTSLFEFCSCMACKWVIWEIYKDDMKPNTFETSSINTAARILQEIVGLYKYTHEHEKIKRLIIILVKCVPSLSILADEMAKGIIGCTKCCGPRMLEEIDEQYGKRAYECLLRNIMKFASKKVTCLTRAFNHQP